MARSAAQEKKYKKYENVVVKAFRKRPTIGFLTSGVAEPLRLVMWTSVAEAAQEQNANIICIAGGELDNASENRSPCSDIFKIGNDDIVDALVMWGASISNYVPQETYIEFCKQFKSKPMINIGHEVAGIPTVTTDDYIGMRNMVLHLVQDHGFRRIAFIRGPEAQIGAEERFKAYKDVLQEAGIEINPDLISQPGAWDGYTGGNAIRLFIDERNERFEAVVGANDSMSLDAIWTLKGYGQSVPEDVAVVGFDDQITAKAAIPPLTTVHQPFREQCRRAVDMALQMLQGAEVPERVIIPTTLFIRESCGCSSPAVKSAATMHHLEKEVTSKSDARYNSTVLELVQIANVAIEGSGDESVAALFNHFLAEIQDGVTGEFLHTLEQIIKDTITEDGEIGIWQNAVSSLRRYARSRYSDESTLVRVEDLCGQARVLISERLQQAELYQKMITERQYVEFREITKALYTAFGLDELSDALFVGLPRLGIRSCYISLYERIPDLTDGELRFNKDASRMILAFDGKGLVKPKERNPFPTTDLLTQVKLASRKNRFSFVVEALLRGRKQLGTALFEVDPPEGRACDILQEQISIAIEAALLLQEREKEEEDLRNAYAAIEKQVVERTAELEQEIIEKMQTKEALSREQHLLRSLMDYSPDYIYFKDLDSRFIKINAALADKFGLSDPDQAIGKTDFDFFAEDHAKVAFEDEKRLIETGATISGKEERETWPDGREAWVSTTKLPLLEEDGNVAGTLGISRDIDKRKKAEKEIIRRATHFEALNTIIAAANAATDLPQLLEIALERALHALGLETGSIWIHPYVAARGMTSETQELITEAMRAYSQLEIPETLVVEDWQAAANTGNPLLPFPDLLIQHDMRSSLTVPIVAEENRRIGGISLTAQTPRTWSDEEIALAEAVGKQLGTTAQRLRLLERIQEQVRQVQQIIDTVPEGVLLLDRTGHVILANPAGKNDLGTLANAQLGDTLTHLGDISIQQIFDAPSQDPWQQIGIGNQIFEIIARPLDSGVQSEGWVLVIRDVTQERETQRRVYLQERLAAVGQMAAGIAHDFNNILVPVTLYSEMLLEEPTLRAEAQEWVKTILSLSQRATSVTQQFLDFSRKGVMSPVEVNLRDFFEDFITLINRMLPENIHVIHKPCEEQVVIRADPGRLQQVLINLAINARDAMSDDGKLIFDISTLTVQPNKRPPYRDMKPGAWLRLRIIDNGIGIPSDVLPHIFEPFFTTKPVGQGTGLGLSQVYGIIKQHDGYIDVESSQGKGTIFTIYLPVFNTQASTILYDDDFDTLEGNLETLLLVEDEPEVRDALSRVLKSLNYRVITASDGKDALRHFDNGGEKVDLVLSDVIMPGLSGPTLFRILNEKQPGIKMLLITGYPLDEGTRELLESNLVSWVQKPVDKKTLADSIQKILNA
jgi:two-component system cell cycle sensor histidine kinase/response regulator CckA